MKDIISCKYMEKYDTLINENNSSGELRIIQTLCNEGEIIIGEETYPATYGSLYFINSPDNYSIVPGKQSEYLQSSIVISKEYLNNLAKLLDFEKEFEKIFIEKEISFLPIKHYKIIDNRFKKMSGVLNSEKKFSKALFTAQLIELLYYAVYYIYSK